ncbi:hypothetical protein MHYP_G00310190 [Metynnis hypsauchen]
MCTFPVLHTNRQNITNSISLLFFRVYDRPHVRPDTEGQLTVEPSCYSLQTSCPRPSYHHLPWTSCPPYIEVSHGLLAITTTNTTTINISSIITL